LVMARNARCVAPGCGSPATACDQDHTREWEDGGITCGCNLAPLCRRHHKIKQAQGWKLEQPEPGILVWTTPAGLTRTTTPTRYQD
ncbi:MAG TPA: HNH endonuclease signature motif containing protein, partial [Streptosporangiaceae bacterium]|nr:HNH endonuclease signature motif containing protein [Streptosporangiaceae bacterium]